MEDGRRERWKIEMKERESVKAKVTKGMRDAAVVQKEIDRRRERER